MGSQRAPAEVISNALARAMTAYARGRDWQNEIYGIGPYPHPIEVCLTGTAIAALGGMTEITQQTEMSQHIDQHLLSAAFVDIAGVVGVAARIDGFVPSLQCFVEVKVSKLDKVHGNQDGRCLYDIGQWAHDIGRLAILGRHLPRVGLLYSVVAIQREATIQPSREGWIAAFKHKLSVELANDCRNHRELHTDHPHRMLQLSVLQTLTGVRDDAFCVVAQEKWAVLTIEARPFLACLIG